MSRKDSDAVWRALGDPTRRTILDLLRDGPRTTGDLCDAFHTSRFAVMKHLAVLEEAGLVTVRRRGRQRWNAINAVPLRRVYDRWVSKWADRGAVSLLSLQSVAEAARKDGPMEVRTMEIGQDVRIDAPPAHVWKTLTQDINRWWQHRTWEGSSVALELRAGGVFGESKGTHERFYATVTRIEPEKRLSLQGSMGMQYPVQGTIDYVLEPDGNGTLLKLTHRAFGDLDEETESMYVEGWRELFEALKPFAEGRAGAAVVA